MSSEITVTFLHSCGFMHLWYPRSDIVLHTEVSVGTIQISWLPKVACRAYNPRVNIFKATCTA